MKGEVTKRLLWLLLAHLFCATSFQPIPTTRVNQLSSRSLTGQAAATELKSADNNIDQNEIIAKRIIVKGNVQGGYYRSCVLNEAGRFRRLVGTMTPPDDTDKAEIYVEGKRKLVDGFVRWCKRGNVGLSQVVGVEEILEEEPTGLYDGFYVKTK